MTCTADADGDLLYGALASGARGYALKTSSTAELVGAIERVAAGGSYVDPRLDRILLSPRATAQIPQLSPRERESMRLMAEGATAQPIARKSLRARWRRLWRRLRR
jgi:DNA-binding NarL/FixJ family response regulator